MVRHCLLILCLVAGCILWCSTGSAGSGQRLSVFPQTRSETYAAPDKRIHVYRVQEPETLGDSPNILIYMHGSAGEEEQGMDPFWARGTFARLRALMNRWGWVYVCPRDAEFPGLLKHLRQRYAPRAIYLAGASGGGNVALREAANSPSSYAGLLLLCPAAGRRGRNYSGRLAMPVWIVSAARDREISRQCRGMARELEALQRPFVYREIAGGHHGTPVERVDWQKALEFLQQKNREVLAQLPKVPVLSSTVDPPAGRLPELSTEREAGFSSN